MLPGVSLFIQRDVPGTSLAYGAGVVAGGEPGIYVQAGLERDLGVAGSSLSFALGISAQRQIFADRSSITPFGLATVSLGPVDVGLYAEALRYSAEPFRTKDSYSEPDYIRSRLSVGVIIRGSRGRGSKSAKPANEEARLEDRGTEEPVYSAGCRGPLAAWRAETDPLGKTVLYDEMPEECRQELRQRRKSPHPKTP